MGFKDQRNRETYASGDSVLTLVPRKVLVRLLVVLPELLHDILADITVLLLDLPRNLQLVLGRDIRHLTTLPHQVEHKLGNVAASDGDVLDRAADDVPLRTGNDVSNTITRVDDCASERAVGDTV